MKSFSSVDSVFEFTIAFAKSSNRNAMKKKFYLFSSVLNRERERKTESQRCTRCARSQTIAKILFWDVVVSAIKCVCLLSSQCIVVCIVASAVCFCVAAFSCFCFVLFRKQRLNIVARTSQQHGNNIDGSFEVH